jgi:hypothetical protein
MAVALSHYPPLRPVKRQRRTATAVLAGDFNPRPQRDVLTSLLNGVGLYAEVERDEGTRRERKRQRRERERERRRVQRELEKAAAVAAAVGTGVAGAASQQQQPPQEPSSDKARGKLPQPLGAAASAFWRARPGRPTIHIATMQRSVSVTPPPMASSPESTPEHDDASTVTSRTSSKRPRTPDDDESIDRTITGRAASPPKPKKKRVAARKGWKGWVEGSPPPSEKLINLDHVVVLNERKTRSGKSFDAIGEGLEGWI